MQLALHYQSEVDVDSGQLLGRPEDTHQVHTHTAPPYALDIPAGACPHLTPRRPAPSHDEQSRNVSFGRRDTNAQFGYAYAHYGYAQEG